MVLYSYRWIRSFLPGKGELKEEALKDGENCCYTDAHAGALSEEKE